MGGFTYTTKQGDMWDYIAWKVYGDESLVYLLYRENPKYLDTFIFNEGVKLYCPEVEVINEDEDEDVVKIVRTKSFGIKPMDAEEACIQMELLGHNFFVFLNAETDEVNVVYKRKGGTFGLIEPNFD